MRFINFSSTAIAAIFAAVIWTGPASADSFKPMKFLQDASAIAAIASAVAQLEGCEDDLVFSEQKKKGEDGRVITVAITCNRLPGDNGKLGRATARVEMELDQDGSIGSPLGFSYD